MTLRFEEATNDLFERIQRAWASDPSIKSQSLHFRYLSGSPNFLTNLANGLGISFSLLNNRRSIQHSVSARGDCVHFTNPTPNSPCYFNRVAHRAVKYGCGFILEKQFTNSSSLQSFFPQLSHTFGIEKFIEVGELLHDIFITPSRPIGTLDYLKLRPNDVFERTFHTGLSSCAKSAAGVIFRVKVIPIPGLVRTVHDEPNSRYIMHDNFCYKLEFSHLRHKGETQHFPEYEELLKNYAAEALLFALPTGDPHRKDKGILHPQFEDKYRQRNNRILKMDFSKGQHLLDPRGGYIASLSSFPEQLELSNKYKPLVESINKGSILEF